MILVYRFGFRLRIFFNRDQFKPTAKGWLLYRFIDLSFPWHCIGTQHLLHRLNMFLLCTGHAICKMHRCSHLERRLNFTLWRTLIGKIVKAIIHHTGTLRLRRRLPSFYRFLFKGIHNVVRQDKRFAFMMILNVARRTFCLLHDSCRRCLRHILFRCILLFNGIFCTRRFKYPPCRELLRLFWIVSQPKRRRTQRMLNRSATSL